MNMTFHDNSTLKLSNGFAKCSTISIISRLISLVEIVEIMELMVIFAVNNELHAKVKR